MFTENSPISELPRADALSGPILDLLPIGVVIMDVRELRILAANTAVRSLPGAPWREIAVVGRRLRDLPDDPNIRRFATACRYVLRTGEPLRIEAFPLGGDAPAYWDFSFAPVRSSDGAVVRLLATITDVTQEVTLRRAMEASNQELRRQNADLATLNRLAINVSSSHDFITLCQTATEALLDLFGFSQGGVSMLGEDRTDARIVAFSSAGRRIDWNRTRIPVADNPVFAHLTRRLTPLAINDIESDPIAAVERDLWRRRQAKSILLVPIVVRGEMIGAIGVDATVEPHHFTDAEIDLAVRVAEQLSVAMQNARLAEELQRRADDLESLNAIGQVVSSSLNLTTVLDRVHRVLSSLRDIVAYDRASICVLEADMEHLLVVTDTAEGGNQRGQHIPLDGSLRGYVFLSARSLYIGDIAADDLPLSLRLAISEYPTNIVLVPLIVTGQPIGVLSVLGNTAGSLTRDDAQRIERVAAQVAIAVANARLYERVQGQVEELRLLNADLAEANKHKSVFLATMSHELRTPLNAIIGFAELLYDDIIAEPEERRESLLDILRSGQHLLTLINDVLDLTKVEAGQMTLAPVPLDLRHELASVDRIMSPLFAQRRQRYSYSAPPDFPPVYADAGRMRQVILNILSNANKFTPDGGTIALTASVNGDGEAQIAIADSGIGIKAADIPLIWQEFRQIDTSMNRKYEGTGLGLTLTRRLLALMHGRIWLESVPGVGTTFYLTLPLACGENA
ncbi:MAG: GAF domain-containing protein [Thermomicrobia bacterium]|nr:GAF domain-containing protein [Thermomicrobia bacterium]